MEGLWGGCIGEDESVGSNENGDVWRVDIV